VVLALAPGANAQLRRGMTFTVLEQVPGYVRVGADGATNPYAGDTTVDQYRSLLCVNVDQRPAPSSISFDFYNGWVRGSLQVTSPVQGSALTSRARADEICAQTFGFGHRMAEFHDGYYGPGFAYAGGWSFWGAGSITTGTRFWTAIDDQPANPWNSAGGTPQSVDDILATIDIRALSQVVRFGSDAEIAAFYTPIANQIGDYVLARYDEDLRGEIADNPEAAVVVRHAPLRQGAWHSVGSLRQSNRLLRRDVHRQPSRPDALLHRRFARHHRALRHPAPLPRLRARYERHDRASCGQSHGPPRCLGDHDRNRDLRIRALHGLDLAFVSGGADAV
jgi:hypothetical protein